MARDNMLPFSHVWRHVSHKRRSPTYVVLGLFCLSTVLLLSALVSERAFTFILGISSLAVFVTYVLQTFGAIVGARRGTIPAAEPGTFDLGRWRMPVYIVGLISFTAVVVALVFLPQFAGNGWVFLGIIALAALWWATGLRARLRRGDAGPNYAVTKGL
jgi:amino acid transporter